jgi:hypothetical protein
MDADADVGYKGGAGSGGHFFGLKLNSIVGVVRFMTGLLEAAGKTGIRTDFEVLRRDMRRAVSQNDKKFTQNGVFFCVEI